MVKSLDEQIKSLQERQAQLKARGERPHGAAQGTRTQGPAPSA